jgi:sugar phosphate isomerase/epimerase
MDSAMSTRRNFLVSSAATAALAAAPRTFRALAPTLNIPVGLQLYTVRHLAETSDLATLLKQIHGIGYQEVEGYWSLYKHPARDLRKMVADAGLHIPSGHFDYEALRDSTAKQLDYAHDLGLDWVVCPMMPKSQWASVEGFRTAVADFNRWGQRAEDQGMRFAFHNHNYEFQKFPGAAKPVTGYDILVNETDPAVVWFEMDCYWITQSGNDPLAMLKRLGKRVRMLHLKDRQPNFPTTQTLNNDAEHFTEVGSGTIHWRAILEAAQKLGVEHYFVEQDSTSGPPLDSIRTSLENLQRILR